MKKNLKNIFIILIPVIVVLGSLIIYRDLGQKYSFQNFLLEESARPDAEDFKIYDSSGNKAVLSDFLGKPMVMNLWATWCPYCIDEFPGFQKAYDEFGEDINFLMINMTDGERETAQKAENFISESGYNFPVYYDIDREVYQKYLLSFPTSVFIDKNGKIAYIQRGAISELNLLAILKELSDS